MRVAKADQKDIETTRTFLQMCEMFWDNRNRFSFKDTATEWQELPDEDEDKILLLKIRKGLAEEEDISEGEVDNRLIVYEFLRRKYIECDCNWGRVILAADILIDNVCDPTEGHLAFHPSFESFHVTPEQ